MPNSIYGTNDTSKLNSLGFSAQPINDDNQMANFVQSSENLGMGTGVSGQKMGRGTTQQGLGAFAPVLSYLTLLTKGDQGSLAQATQPQANQIQDSFAAVRNMISGQPRGGGKAGVLAEAPYQQSKQIGDMQQGARSGAAGQLGNVANMLAGLGQGQESLGLNEITEALNTAMNQRGQNVQERASTQQMITGLASAAGKTAAAMYTGK